MSSSSTSVKRQRIAARQRVSVSDLEDISSLGIDNQAEFLFAALCADDYVIEGMQIVHTSGSTFHCNNGAVLVGGEVLRLTGSGVSLGAQDAIVNPGDNRIDIVYIDPANQWVESTTDAATKTVMSSISITSVSAEAVGTGNSSTKSWDLANSLVDPSTLKVYLAGSQEVDGWVFSKGTGTAGVDQIIFDVAPGAVAITADYDYLTGGVESSASVDTRYERIPNPQVWKGTESASPTYATELTALQAAVTDPILLASITYGTGWSTGAPSAIDNTIKSFLLTPDNLAEASGVTHTPNKTATGSFAGRIMHPLRNIHGLKHGFRLRWSSATELKVGAGWGVCRGVAFSSDSDVTFSPVWNVDITGVGWYSVFLTCQPTNTTAPGSAPEILVTTTSPDGLRRKSTSTGTFYVGSIYNTSASAVSIREFTSRGDSGDMFWWDSPTDISFGGTVGGGAVDLDLAAWCPPTGQEIFVEVEGALSEAEGEIGDLVANSRTVATARGFPRVYLRWTSGHATINWMRGRGWLIVEQDGSARKINTTRTVSAAGSLTGKIWVLGYRDSALTMDGAGPTILTH